MKKRYCCYLLLLPMIVGFLSCRQTEKNHDDKTDIFMWMGSNHLIEKEPRMYKSMMAFAARHDIIPYESGANSVEDLENFLEQVRKAGINRSWIEIGPGNGVTIREFVEEPQKREATLQRFRRLARTYKSYNPDVARVTIFDEAPLGAFDHNDSSKNYQAIFNQFKQYAPKAFSLMYRAFKEEFPEAEVGIFLHHPHNASPQTAGRYSYIESFMKSADSLGSTPDFIYSDVYRGYFNRGYGQEATDRYITDVVRHSRKVARRYDAETYQLGQVHTIKLGYTPSRRQIDTNIDAMLRGNPDGIGWYWPNYAGTNTIKSGGKLAVPTEVDVSFDPFIPNNWGNIGPAGSLYGTSRDRFSYGYLRMLEATDQIEAEKSFDLWLYGHDFDHVEHSVWLKAKNAPESEWTYIGHINPQQDADAYEDNADNNFRYSYNNRWHAVAFRGLSREKFFSSDSLADQNELEIKIKSTAGSDGSEITAVYTQPYYQSRHFATEEKITNLIEQQPRWVEINSLASYLRPVSFSLNNDTTLVGTLRSSASPSGTKSYQNWLNSLDTE